MNAREQTSASHPTENHAGVRESRAIDLTRRPASSPWGLTSQDYSFDSRTHLRAMAHEVREGFLQFHRRLYHSISDAQRTVLLATWDGGNDRWGRQQYTIWPQLVRCFLEQQLDPYEFVGREFGRLCGQKITPKHLLQRAPIEARQGVLHDLDRIKMTFERESRYIVWNAVSLQEGLGWEREPAMDYALLDQAQVRASPLTRYLLALREGRSNVAGELHEGALLRYAYCKILYDAAYTGLIDIPPGLREQGGMIRDAARTVA